MQEFDYLQDEAFLAAIDAMNIRIQYAKIELWSYDEKNLLRNIEGSVTAGSLTVNGTSAARRSVSLTILAQEHVNDDLTNINNEISLNKKFDLYIGYENLLPNYQHYGKIIWFPCGRFIISTASITRNTNSWNISIQGKDKMSKLDGTVGGTLPASVTFHEVELEDGTIENPTIFEIITHAVHQYGMEPYDNIIINDLETKARALISYAGPANIYFENNFTGYVYKAKVEKSDGTIETIYNSAEQTDNFPYKTIYGQNVGYQETDLTYPGTLILNAGDTVVSLLTKINEILGGNFEFFYNLKGQFVFQEKRNYLNTTSPLNQIDINSYVETYNTTKCRYEFNDLSQISSFGINPKYENIKNDFIVWGERTTGSGAARPIRYHLAIDEKPTDLSLASQYMFAVYDNFDTEQQKILRYDFLEYLDPNIEATLYTSYEVTLYDEEGYSYLTKEYEYNKPYIVGNEHKYLIGKPSQEWREELYRRALINNQTDFALTGYDIELLSEWRKLYDTLNYQWRETNGWNPDVIYNHSQLDYWLDFIDTSALGAYSVNQIGKRTKVENKNTIKSLYQREPLEDILFVPNSDRNKLQEYEQNNQKYFLISDEDFTYFTIASGGMTAFDQMRSLLQTHLFYNTAVSITCTPRYYFEPNQLIFINDGTDNKYNGTYFMTQFTLPLTYNGNMTITANELAKRI